MSKSFTLAVIAFFLNGSYSHAQINKGVTDDEKARISFSVHLLTYDTVSHFESALGEAYYKALTHSVKESYSMILLPNSLSGQDKLTCLAHAQRFQAVIENPPSWDVLIQMEEQYQIWLDRALRRKSKYKL